MLVDTLIQDLPLTLSAPQPIEQFSEGTLVELSAITGERNFCRRLESMGLAPGKQVRILKSRGQALLLKTAHTRLALRLSPAFCLEAFFSPA